MQKSLKINRKKYILDCSLLQPGDIILTGSKEPVSLAVRAATASRFSHAAIYVGKTTIEATLAGVFSKNPQRLAFSSPDDVAVMRSKHTLSEIDRRRVCSFARSLTGSLYALDEAITIRARSILSINETRKQFCSRLVAQSYASIEYDFINLRNPSYCTPRQLYLCKAFEEINEIVRVGNDHELQFAASPDPNVEHQRQTYDWLNKVRALAKDNELLSETNIQTINDVNEFLLQHPGYDEKICEFMTASGYLEFYNYDVKVNPYRYNEQWFLLTIQKYLDGQEFLQGELDKEDEMCSRFLHMLNGYLTYFDKRDLKYFRLHVQLYMNLLAGVFRRFSVMKYALEITGQRTKADMLTKVLFIVAKAYNSGRRRLEGSNANR